MAWISVHEQVIGGKLRELSKEIGCSQNEALGILLRFWLWGINNADKEGRITGADKEDVAEVLTVGKSKELVAEDIVEAMITTGWLDEEGDHLFIHDWEEWQEQWYKAMDFREKNAARQKKYRERQRQSDNAKPEPPAPAQKPELPDNPPEPPKAPAKKTSGYTSAFEEFWKAYPRKVGKGDAYKKYKARLNDGFSEEALLEAAINYAAKCNRERTEEKYIKHAKTFLSDTLPFTDFIRKEQQAHNDSSDTDDGGNPFEKFIN